MEDLKTLEVEFHHATKDEVLVHTISLPKESTVEDLINDLKTKVELSNKDAELRLFDVMFHQIYQVHPLERKIEEINGQYSTLRAEEIPEEEKNLGPHDRLIHVYHFKKTVFGDQTNLNSSLIRNFGDPFFLVIRESETLAEIKERIQKKLNVPYGEFSQWRFAVICPGRSTYFQDSDVVSTHFQSKELFGAFQRYLGLEQPDPTSIASTSRGSSGKCCNNCSKRTNLLG